MTDFPLRELLLRLPILAGMLFVGSTSVFAAIKIAGASNQLQETNLCVEKLRLSNDLIEMTASLEAFQAAQFRLEGGEPVADRAVLEQRLASAISLVKAGMATTEANGFAKPHNQELLATLEGLQAQAWAFASAPDPATKAEEFQAITQKIQVLIECR